MNVHCIIIFVWNHMNLFILCFLLMTLSNIYICVRVYITCHGFIEYVCTLVCYACRGVTISLTKVPCFLIICHFLPTLSKPWNMAVSFSNIFNPIWSCAIVYINHVQFLLWNIATVLDLQISLFYIVIMVVNGNSYYVKTANVLYYTSSGNCERIHDPFTIITMRYK